MNTSQTLADGDSKKDFFISYNRADRPWAEWIGWVLEENGYSVIIQAWDFRPGGNFVIEMHQAARNTERTIAVLSNDYLAAEYTHPEWAEAFRRDPQGTERTLLPILVQDCQPDGMLGARTYIKLLGLEEEQAQDALLEGVKKGRVKPSRRPGFPGRPLLEGERLFVQKPEFPRMDGDGGGRSKITQVGLQNIEAEELEGEVEQDVSSSAPQDSVEQVGIAGVTVRGKAVLKVNQKIQG